MKIKSIKAYLLASPLKRPLEFSFGIKTDRTTALFEIETDDGIIGWGEANWGGSVAGGKSLLSLVDERVRPGLIGKDPFQTERIWRSMDELSQDANRVAASGAVDMALYDIQGQVLGRPICDLLGGGFRDWIPMYASDLMIDPLPMLEKRTEELLAMGFTGVKMRIGRVAAEDPARVGRVRQIIGPDRKLIVDANGNYNRREALRVGKALEAFDLEHFEEPLPKWDVEGCALLREQLNMPIAAGECTHLFHIKDILARHAAQVVQPDVTINGFTETRKILALAEAYRAEVVMHNFEGGVGLAGTLHVAAASPLLKQLQELDQNPSPFREELLEEPIRFEKGSLEVPKGPGIGVKINRAVLKKYQIGASLG